MRITWAFALSSARRWSRIKRRRRSVQNAVSARAAVSASVMNENRCAAASFGGPSRQLSPAAVLVWSVSSPTRSETLTPLLAAHASSDGKVRSGVAVLFLGLGVAVDHNPISLEAKGGVRGPPVGWRVATADV